MSLLVKICGLQEQRDVQAAVDAGADALGFVFAASVRQISPSRARQLCTDVPRHVRRVAVMLHPSADEWQAVLEDFSPDVLQTDAKDYAALAVPESVQRWPVFREGGLAPVGDDAYVYEGKHSGEGATVDWSQAAAVAEHGAMILAGGLHSQNVAEAIRVVKPFGVDVSSGVESSRGVKSSERIVAFLQAAKAAENNI